MWRIARTVVIFLLLGLALNLAVAWSLRLVKGPNPTAVLVDHVTVVTQDSSGQPRMSFGTMRIYDSAFDHFIIERVENGETTQRTVAEPTAKTVALNDRYIGTYSAGWPWHSFRCWVNYPPGTTNLFKGGNAEITGGVPLPEALGATYGGRALPMTPVWPGALTNTLLYACTLWLLFGMPFALRRVRRVRAQRCPACAYPWGTSVKCTECGCDLSKWVAAPAGAAPTP